MDFKLIGKRTFVTGSTQGIGFAIAQGLAREGAAVVVNGRGEAKVKDAVKRIAAGTKGSVTGIAGDVGAASNASSPNSDRSTSSSTTREFSSRSRSSKLPTATGFVTSR
jgi:NAD(P)-dependent dehydrogenase (short-subunit alcohol dehydrogenase family)